MTNANEASHLQLVEDRPPSVPPPDPLIGRTLDGRYRIESVLGEGGMGLVYRARHAVLNKLLAIKVLKPEVSRDQEVLSRFQQEAQSASGIGNQHIIDISDFGTLPDHSTYFVMEYLDGQSLTKAVETQTPMSPERVVHIAKQLCDALGAAHERSIVHRDMKPDNVYLIKRGGDVDFVKVLDFGIAKVGGASSKLTKAGQVFGTPHYMSPEQCAGSNVDARTDIYALGIILYEMSVGRVPFDADNLMGILTKHMYEQPIPPHQLPPPVNVPPGLESIIMKCLSKSTDARYQTMAEVHADLSLLEQGQTPRATMQSLERSTGTGMRVDATGRMAVPSMIRMGVGDVPEAPPAKSKLPLFIGIGVVAMLSMAAVGAAVIGMSGQEAVTPLASTPPTAPPTTPVGTATGDVAGASTGVAGSVAGGPAAGSTAAGSTAAGSVPPEVAPALSAMIQITSEPDGVEVWHGDELVGNTPLEVARPREGEPALEVSLRKPGFASQSVRLSSLTQPTVRIALAPEARRGGGGPRAGGRHGGTAATTTTTTPATGAGTHEATPQPRQPLGQSEVLDPWR